MRTDMFKFVSGINLQEGYATMAGREYAWRIEQEAWEQKHYLCYKEALEHQALVNAIAEEMEDDYK